MNALAMGVAMAIITGIAFTYRGLRNRFDVTNFFMKALLMIAVLGGVFLLYVGLVSLLVVASQ